MPTDNHSNTVYYRKWNIQHTAKEGWRPKDLTISATYEEGKAPDSNTMTEMAEQSIFEAESVCNQLNATMTHR